MDDQFHGLQRKIQNLNNNFCLYELINYQNGKMDGKYMKYYADGNISTEIEYKDGL